MKKILLIISFVATLLLVFQKTSAQSLQPISIQSGFNADVVANGIGTSASSTTTDVDGVSFAFISRDFQLTSGAPVLTYGLPLNGVINSAVTTPAGLSYQLAPYSGNNTLRLQNANDTGTLVLSSPIAAVNLYMLATGGSGACTVNVTINFADATTQTVSTIAIADWYNAANFAIQGIGRISRTTDILETGGGTNPRLYQIPIAVTAANQAKLIQSITITKSGTGGIPNIFAFTAQAYTACLPATNITYSATSDGGVFNWTASAPASGYEYAVTTSATLPTSGTATTTTSAAISGLNANTAYYFHIRSACAGGTFGFWSSTLFTTACGSVTNYVQNFDTSTTGVGNLPACWSKAGTSANVYTTTGSVVPMTPANRLYMNITAATTAFAILPAVSNLQANTHRLKFKAYASTTTKKVRVGYFTNLLDVTTYVLLQEFNLPSTAATAAEFSISPSSIPVGISNLVLTIPSGVATTAYFDDFKWEMIPACPDVTGLIVGGITSSGAATSWDVITGVTGYEYAVTTSATPPASGTATANPFAVISGLTPQTVYYLHVRSTCTGGIVGLWTTSTAFTTACGAIVTPVLEPFDTFLPTVCWLKGDNGDLTAGPALFGTNSWKSDGFGNIGATGSIAYNHYTTGANDWIISPQIVIPAIGYELKFDAALTQWNGVVAPTSAWDDGDVLEVLVSTTGFTNWTVLYTINNTNPPPPNGSSISVNLDAYASQTIRIAYRVVSGAADTADDTDVFVDNFKVRLVPTCPDTTNLVVGGITATGANVSWDALTGVIGYEYAVTTSATPPASGTATTSTFAIISGLNPQTVYYLHVRSACAAGIFGNWTTSASFITLCAPLTILPWNEGFEGITTVGTTAFPPCWLKENGDYSTAIAGTYNTPNTGTKYLRDSWSATDEYMWTPGFNLTAGTSYDFSSYVQGDGYTGWVVDYFVNSTQSSSGASQLGTSYSPLGTGTASIQSYSYVNRTFVPTTTGVYYFAVRVNQPLGSPWYLAFDDFELKLSPACPVQTGLVANGVTSTGANASWDAMSGAVSYEYAVTTSATPPVSGTATTTTYAILSGLAPQTTYYLYVRSICAGATVGGWASPFSFTTLCASVTAFTQNFDGVTASTLPSGMPTCWSKVGSLGTCYTSTATPVASAPNVLYLFGSTTAAPTMRMQPVSNLGSGTHRIKFKMRGTSATVFPNLAFGYLTDPADATTFVTLTTFVPTGLTFTSYAYSPPAGTYSNYPAVKMNGTVYGTLYLDDFAWEPNPACPDQTGVVVSGITSSGANSSWDASTGAAGYEYAIATSATPPTSGTSTTATFQALSGLTPQTLYYLHVRPMCSAGVYGNWATTSFTTACAPVATLPWTENFDALTTGTNIFPACWGYVNTTNTWSISATPVAFSGANSLRRTWSTDGWAFTPLINLTAGTSYRFSYYVRTNDAIVGYDNTVAVGNGQSVTDMTTTLFTQTGYQNPTWTKQNIEFTPTTTGSYSFGLHVVAPVAPNGENFDNFVVELSPTCPDQTGVVVSGATTTSASASWTAVTGAAGYQYAVTTSATPPTSGTATTATLQALSGLTPQTLYYLHVRPMCSAGVYGNWATTSFITGYCIPSSTVATTYVDSFSTTGGTTNISNLATGYTAGGYLNASTQSVQQFATGSFTFDSTIVGGTAGYAIWVDWNNDLVFDNATERVFNTTAYSNGPFTGLITIPAATAIGNYRMRITTNWSEFNPASPCGVATGIRAEFEDYTISVVAPPACSAPAPLSSNVVNVSATLSWPAIASALVGYEYVLDGVVTNPVAAGTTTTATTFNATALSANTTYYFHIRSVCSVGTYSTWTTISFTTSCAPENVPYSQNFETATVPNLTVCTNQQNVGTGNLWATTANPGYGFSTNALRYAYHSTSTANVWFYTNGINLVAGTSYKISYDYGSTGATYPEKLKVAYGTSAAAAAMTMILADHPSIVNGTAPINNMVNFTPATTGVYYFGFNAYSAANQFYLFVDNIMVDVLLGNDSFNTTSFTVYPNPVKDILHINYNDAITKIQVVNMLGQEIITKSVNNTQNEIDMSGLVQGTYLVKITSNDRVKTIKVIKQ